MGFISNILGLGADLAAIEAANKRAAEEARKQAKAAEEAENRARQKKPRPYNQFDLASDLQGQGSTMLTGNSGVMSNSLNLDKNTLLGS